MSTATKLTTIAEVMRDSDVIVYANGSILIAWNRKATLRVYDTLRKRSMNSSDTWGWTEYELVDTIHPDDSDLGVEMNLAWAMDKGADWYEEHGDEY